MHSRNSSQNEECTCCSSYNEDHSYRPFKFYVNEACFDIFKQHIY